jgi:hypothetical protein
VETKKDEITRKAPSRGSGTCETQEPATTEKQTIDGGRRNRAVHNVIDAKGLERKDLGEAAAQFVEQNHGERRRLTVEATLLARGNDHRVKVIVAWGKRKKKKTRQATSGAIRVTLG